MMERGWAAASQRIIFFTTQSSWAAYDFKDEHPWDLDCLWEQLQAMDLDLC